MKCSIIGCSNVYEKSQKLSFHGFPNNPRVLTAWVAATGEQDFIPTHKSKICGDHFEESAFQYCTAAYKKLKPDAVPTKLLHGVAQKKVPANLKQLENNPMACILGTNTSMKEVSLVRDNAPPNTDSTVASPPPPVTQAPANTIKVVDMKKLLQPQAQTVSTATQNSVECKSPAGNSSTSNPNFNKYIYSKVYNNYSPTLIENPGITADRVLTCLKVILPGKFDLSRLIPNEKLARLVIRYLKLDDENTQYQNIVKNHLKIIIEYMNAKVISRSGAFKQHPYSKVNDRDLQYALAVVLPENFCMVDVTDDLLGIICMILKMNIYKDAYPILIRKIQKHCVGTSEYKKFNEILNSSIKGSEASPKMQKEAKINKGGVNVTAIHEERMRDELSVMNDENSDGSEVVFTTGEHRTELVFVDVNCTAETSQEYVDTKPQIEGGISQSPACSSTDSSESDSDYVELDSSSDSEDSVSYKRKNKNSDVDSEDSVSLKGYKRKRKNSDVDLDWNPDVIQVKKSGIKQKCCKKPQPKCVMPSGKPEVNRSRLCDFIQYLHENKLHAEDALLDFHTMFNLCRHFKIRPRRENRKKVEAILNYIVDNKLNINNVEDHFQHLQATQLCSKHHASNKRPTVVKMRDDIKLKMKPIVVLRDLLDYSLNQLLFMRKENVKSVKSSVFHEQTTFSLKQNESNKKLSTDQVRKLTEDSFKQFRRIVMKRNGTKAFFCVKYAKLVPGTVVYAKNFKRPDLGWVKGVVYKSLGPLKYQVKMDDNSIWCCTADQLRPLLNRVLHNIKVVDNVEDVKVNRKARPIKPKQLLDL